MTISRRLALSCAAALAATGRNTLASTVKSALASPRRGRARSISGGAQRFLELLIHHDEAGRQPYVAELSIASPDTAWYAIDTLDNLKYKMTNHVYKLRGYRLRRVKAFHTSRGVRFSACWQLASGPEWHTRHGMTQPAFDAACADYARRGFRTAYLDVRVHYTAIWERGDPSTQQVVSGLSLADFESRLADLGAQDYRPIRISTTTAVGAPQFSAIFEKAAGVAWLSRHEMSLSDFRKANAQAIAQGYRMTDASGHMQDGKARFAGIWEMA